MKGGPSLQDCIKLFCPGDLVTSKWSMTLPMRRSRFTSALKGYVWEFALLMEDEAFLKKAVGETARDVDAGDALLEMYGISRIPFLCQRLAFCGSVCVEVCFQLKVSGAGVLKHGCIKGTESIFQSSSNSTANISRMPDPPSLQNEACTDLLTLSGEKTPLKVLVSPTPMSWNFPVRLERKP